MATITVGTNSYVTEAELTTYATDRGDTVSGTASVLLIKAMDWLELQSFIGSKTDSDQDLEWPRDGAWVDGNELDKNTVPQRIKNAQMAAALLIDSGEDLQPNIGRRVVSESVDGAVSRQYSDNGNQSPVFTKLNALLSGYVKSGAGSTFAVGRA